MTLFLVLLEPWFCLHAGPLHGFEDGFGSCPSLGCDDHPAVQEVEGEVVLVPDHIAHLTLEESSKAPRSV